LPDASGLHLVPLAPPRASRECHEPPRPIGHHQQAPVQAPTISPLFCGRLTINPAPRPLSTPTHTSSSSTPTCYSSPPSQPVSMASSPGHCWRVSPPDPHRREGPVSVSFLTSLPPKLIPLITALLLHIFPHWLPPLAHRSSQHCRRPMVMPCPTLFPHRAASLAPFGTTECSP
jgi:hypothetical protein